MTATWIAVSDALPAEGVYCWVSDGQNVWIAYHSEWAANGWSNGDTWEDFEGRVTHWMEIVAPEAPGSAEKSMDGR
jgi:hypothetical protein